MNQELDYAQMLEIPVSTVNVVKKKPLFRKRQKTEDDLKGRVVESVNERVSDGFVATESMGDYLPEMPPKPEKSGVLGKVIMCEGIAACLIAAGIFLTNVFVPQTVINAFMGNLTAVKQKEVNYTDFALTPVVSELSDAEVKVGEDGVLRFTEKTSVYPVCDGQVESIKKDGELYVVKIAHTSTFSSVFTGLDTVYAAVGDKVEGNVPFAYSKGESEVCVSMYDGETALTCYTLSGTVPVWKV